jgi:hypothetical protein
MCDQGHPTTVEYDIYTLGHKNERMKWIRAEREMNSRGKAKEIHLVCQAAHA